MMPGWIGPWEIIILVGIILFLFGTKRLPEVGRSLGRGARELKEAVSIQEAVAVRDEVKESLDDLKPWKADRPARDGKPAS